MSLRLNYYHFDHLDRPVSLDGLPTEIVIKVISTARAINDYLIFVMFLWEVRKWQCRSVGGPAVRESSTRR